MKDKADKDLLFYYKSSLKIGEAERYIITYNLYEGDEIPLDITLSSLWMKLKNLEPLPHRMAYLMGPFTLYCDLRLADYSHNKKIISSIDKPKFISNLQPQQSNICELSVHTIEKKIVWIVDIVSQILFTTNSTTCFEILLGDSKDSLNNANFSKQPVLSSSANVFVTRLTSLDLWNLPQQLSVQLTSNNKNQLSNSITVPSKSKKKHLIVLTHGLHSNVPTDMSYIMEQLYSTQKNFPNEQLIVKGYSNNVCQTEKGIKFLGTNVAKAIINDWYDEDVVKISFIGHSLGGLVQTFTIAYISVMYPWFFEKVEPINFITLASPLLGILTDNPQYINFFLSYGVIGKTGQELSLENDPIMNSPLIYLLSGEPVKKILKLFKRRTIYANAINDGIVPLYTASLLFLDYDDILRNLRKLENTSDLTINDKNWNGNPTINGSPNSVNSTMSQPLFKILRHQSLECGVYFSAQQSNLRTTSVPEVPDQHDICGSNSATASGGNEEQTLSQSNEFPPKTPIKSASTSNLPSKLTKSSIPKISFFESAASVLMPPIPENSYISDPNSRSSIILHDKIYTDEDIPPLDDNEYGDSVYNGSSNILLRAFKISSTINGNRNTKEQKLEENIARRWHEGLSWRKVIVALKPDAHNNILVRRRFPNAYGWPVIDHLIQAHFDGSSTTLEQDSSQLNAIINTAQNTPSSKKHGIEPNKKYAWITRQENPSMFDEGPTGMISTVGEMLESMKKKSQRQMSSQGNSIHAESQPNGINEISELDELDQIDYPNLANLSFGNI
ncbi:hypothetical protein TBLA_0B09570 [Henningerozyma blattae CBS 6284]|uniref:DUF676 domain-containing protein n=1 Tax=Henningerozyma blattae (strain ATCC 34711 / CBS 6284 / DSM 70876 / NBRC 10599 / NRRL Y-10934 / UCD 77-7) TaxID=1071380 RepID=I2H072_HENB6|nr:hypothetical protein TBLA_0B09570 [Tetrapisispora blattae CBS 6284]CCH59774.1 hypothetical protein TBLA_0B09570 [Tetrapisispora blattae CBS 6284]